MMNLRIIPFLILLFNTINLFSQQQVHTVPRINDYIVIKEKYGANGFENLSHRTFSFNEKENQTKRVELDWTMSTNEWRNSYYEDIIYDANDNLVEKKTYFFFTDTNSWLNTSKTINTFDNNGNWTTTASFILDRTNDPYEWVPFDETNFSYDVENNPIESVYKLWKSDLNDWEYRYKNSFEYDNGLKVQSIYSSHNGNSWTFSTKNEYFYNANGSNIETLFSRWNTSSEEWKSPSIKYSYDFDSNENLILYSRSKNNAGQWNQNFKQEFVYDNDNNQIELVRSERYGSIWYLEYKRVTDYYEDHFEKTINEFEWDDTDEIWEPTSRLTFSKNSTLGTIEFEKEISFYPNPVEHKVKIISELDITKVELYNTTGQKVKNTTLRDGFIDLQELSSGFYLLNIYSSEGNVVKRILKK